MKKYLLILFIIIFSISLFSRDNYIFDENRIRKVFSQYELIEYEKTPQIWLDLLDRENELRVQISNYKKGDSKESAKQRFHNNAIKDGFRVKESSGYSKNILGISENSYAQIDKQGSRWQENIFLDKVKISIVYKGTNSDYQNALNLIKEAIDPTMQMKNRNQRTFSKNYSIDNFIDKNKLQNNFKKIYKDVTFDEVKGNAYDLSGYKITVDAREYPRAVWIQANNNYSKKVMNRKSEDYIKSYDQKDWDGKDHSYKYAGEEKKIMPKYFGVNGKVYENDYMKRVLKQDIIGIYRYAVTDKYTITTVTFLVKNQKKVEQEEYEQFISLVKSALKEHYILIWLI